MQDKKKSSVFVLPESIDDAVIRNSFVISTPRTLPTVEYMKNIEKESNEYRICEENILEHPNCTAIPARQTVKKLINFLKDSSSDKF